MTDREPQVHDDKRVLGIVPGSPAVGERKEPDDQDLVMVWPHLLVRHAVAALAVLLLVLVISIFFDAPLRELANPFETPNPEKAPWYFAALQELLSHFHPMVAGVMIPAAIIIGLAGTTLTGGRGWPLVFAAALPMAVTVLAIAVLQPTARRLRLLGWSLVGANTLTLIAVVTALRIIQDFDAVEPTLPFPMF